MRVGRKPLLAVDDPVVAMKLRPSFEDLGIGAALWLGHRERRYDLIVEERLEETLLLIRGAVMRKDFRIAGVRRLTAENDRCEARAPENLIHQSQLHLAIALAAEVRTEMARPELAFPDLGLKRAHERVAFGVAHFVRIAEHVVERLNFFAHELF